MRNALPFLVRLPAMLALAAMLPAAPAWACSLSIMDVTSTTWVGRHGKGYEVFDPESRSLAVSFRVRGRDGSCPFFVTVAAASTTDGTTGELRGGGTALRYEVQKDASGSKPLKPLNLASESDVFVGAIAEDDDTVAFQFALRVPPQQVVAPGHYRGDIEVTAYEGTLGDSSLRDRRRVNVSVPVPAVAELSFAEGAGFDPNYGSYTVSFNVLQRGKRRAVTLKARSNGGYRVTLESEHGALRHVDPRENSEIPYQASIDGGNVTLPRRVPTPAITHAAATDPGGRSHFIEFTVGEIGDASPGDYRDVITLTVVSLR